MYNIKLSDVRIHNFISKNNKIRQNNYIKKYNLIKRYNLLKKYNLIKQYNSGNHYYVKPLLSWLAISIITGILFYDNLLFSVIIFLFCPLYIRKHMEVEKSKEHSQLSIAFKDALLSLSSALEAGYSVENAVYESVRDLKLIYPNTAQIIKEFEYMGNQIKNNISIETVFNEFAKRAAVEDIENFSEILVTAKRTGGDLVKIIKTTASAINEKSEVMHEIKTTMSGKKYEAMIMKAVPYMILLYFRAFSPGYLSVLYGSVQGIILMSIILCIYLFANHITQRIVSIEV